MKAGTQSNILFPIVLVCALGGCIASCFIPFAGNWISSVALYLCLAPACVACFLITIVSRHIDRIWRKEYAIVCADRLIEKCEVLDGNSIELAYLINDSVQLDVEKEGNNGQALFGEAIAHEILSRVPDESDRARIIGRAQLEGLRQIDE